MNHARLRLVPRSRTDAFSLARFRAMVVKEFVQMRRDRLTFGMMIGIPLIQLVLFGFAINSDPKHLPAAVLLADNGPYGRTLLVAIRNSGYFDLVRQISTEEEGQRAGRGELLMAQLKVEQIKSTIGTKPKHRATIEALGLKRIGDTVIKEDRPEIRGMVRAVSHLVTVEEVD
jgi:ribosomal protein L30